MLTGWVLALGLGAVSYKLWNRLHVEHVRAKVLAALGPDPARTGLVVPDWPEDARRVVFAGDSRIARWPLPDAPEGVAFANRGVGGETSAQLLARFDDLMTRTTPDVLVLSIGINDLVAASLDPGLSEQIKSGLERHLNSLISNTKNSSYNLIMTTILHPADPGILRRYTAWSDDIHAEVAAVNRAILALADPPDVQVLDLNAVLDVPEGGPLAAEYAADALHPNARAYARLSAALLNEVSFR